MLGDLLRELMGGAGRMTSPMSELRASLPKQRQPVSRRYEDGSGNVGGISYSARPRPYGRERRFEDGSMVTQGGMRVPAFDSPNDFNRPGQAMGGASLQQGGYNPQASRSGLRLQQGGMPMRGILDPIDYSRFKY